MGHFVIWGILSYGAGHSVIWDILLYGAFCHMGHSVIWGILSYGAFCYMGHSVIWGILSYGAFCHMGHSVIWGILYEILCTLFCLYSESFALYTGWFFLEENFVEYRWMSNSSCGDTVVMALLVAS